MERVGERGLEGYRDIERQKDKERGNREAERDKEA